MTNILWQFYSETALPVELPEDVMSWLFMDINIGDVRCDTRWSWIWNWQKLLNINYCFDSPFKIYFTTLQHLALLLAIFLCCCWFGLDLLPLSLNWYPKGLNSNVCELHCHGGLLTFKLMCADTILASSSRRLLLTLYLTTVPPLSLLCTLDLRLEWQH